jgi:hypothetical protein
VTLGVGSQPIGGVAVPPAARSFAFACAVFWVSSASTVAPAVPAGIGVRSALPVTLTPGVSSVICGSAMVPTATRPSGVISTSKPVCCLVPLLMVPA